MLTLEYGLGLKAEVNPFVVPWLPRLDGSTTVGELTEIVSRESGRSWERSKRDCIEAVERMLRAGLLALGGNTTTGPAYGLSS